VAEEQRHRVLRAADLVVVRAEVRAVLTVTMNPTAVTMETLKLITMISKLKVPAPSTDFPSGNLAL
jgi:hypothetical protein